LWSHTEQPHAVIVAKHSRDPTSAMAELTQGIGISGQLDRQECPVLPIDSGVMAGLGEVEHRAVVGQAVPRVDQPSDDVVK
jgi:hypothetical protein